MNEPSPWTLELLGRVVGSRYRIERMLGEGAMGAVFAARHMTLGRAVAIKLMPPDMVGELEAARRFEQEAVAAASVARRGVVDVLDFGVDPEAGPYIVMELLEGESLEARIRREGTLSPAVTIALLAPVLDALSSVHARSIVHRDLKPANLFVARDEEGHEVVKILDFGVSRVREGRRAPMTAKGVVVGTPRFMAPEQARGAADLDARADLYAMGAIAYACLSGRPPYAELGYVDVIAAILEGPPTPLARLVPSVPPALLAVIERAMARRREERFSNAAEMRAALIAAGQGAPLTTKSDGVVTVVEPRSAPTPVPSTAIQGTPRASDAELPKTRIAMVAAESSTSSVPAPSPASPALGSPVVAAASAVALSAPVTPSSVGAPGFAPPLEPIAPTHGAPAQAAIVPLGSSQPMALRPAPLPMKRGGLGWLVALVLALAVFGALAAYAVWKANEDEEVEGAMHGRAEDRHRLNVLRAWVARCKPAALRSSEEYSSRSVAAR
jgi:serine/threonine-protein kinase